jgi:small subunit ribosomal protein S2
MAIVTMRQLLEAGIHFGHQTRRWNPKMGRFIFGQRNGIYIIDLQKTLKQLTKAYICIRDIVAEGGNVLFVGTKKQAQESVAREAQRCGMFYVNSRWLGGTLTNWETIRQSIRNLQRLEEMSASGRMDEQYAKKEAIKMRKEAGKMDANLHGIKNMPGLPQALFVIDAKKEAIAVREAERLGIPCIGVVDTNCDPDVVPIPVPGNDDAIRAIQLYTSLMAEAVMEGRMRGEKVFADREQRQNARESAAQLERRAEAIPASADISLAVAGVEPELDDMAGLEQAGPEEQ